MDLEDIESEMGQALLDLDAKDVEIERARERMENLTLQRNGVEVQLAQLGREMKKQLRHAAHAKKEA